MYRSWAFSELKKTSHQDASRREHLLVVRLTTKEQELQELSNQIAELKAAQAPTLAAMRNTLLDPAVNIIVQNLKKELEVTKTKMQETQEELSAWKFTPDSVTGKRLMSKCRQLLQENEDIGKMISSGRLAKLEGELSMQKALCEEMKKNQVEMDDFVQELDEDVEGMQSTIYFLQQQLKEAKDKIAKLEGQQQQEPDQVADDQEDQQESAVVDDEPKEQEVEPVEEVEEEEEELLLQPEVSEEFQKEVEAENEPGPEPEAARSTRSTRRGTPTKVDSPRRSTRGQKRDTAEEEDSAPKRPKRKRGGSKSEQNQDDD